MIQLQFPGDISLRPDFQATRKALQVRHLWKDRKAHFTMTFLERQLLSFALLIPSDSLVYTYFPSHHQVAMTKTFHFYLNLSWWYSKLSFTLTWATILHCVKEDAKVTLSWLIYPTSNTTSLPHHTGHAFASIDSNASKAKIPFSSRRELWKTKGT